MEKVQNIMSFWDMEEADDPISKLLSDANVKLTDVLKEGSMLQELRTNNMELIEYFSREDIIRELCEWSMTLKYQNADDFDWTSRTVTEILTCKSTYANRVANSQGLLMFLNEFLDITEEWDPMCAGHFQRILMHLMETTNGQYINKFSGLIDHLINHISTLAAAELLVMLTVQYYDIFNPNGETLNRLAEYILDPKADVLSASYAFKMIFNLGFDKENIARDLTSDAVIAALIQAAKSTNIRLASIELMRTIARISKKNELALVFRRGDVGPVEKVDCANSAYAKQAAGMTPAEAAELLFAEAEPHWAVSGAARQRVRACAPEDLIAEAPWIPERLLARAKAGTLNGPLLDLLRVVRGAPNAELRDPLLVEAVERAEKMCQRFGGDVPIGFAGSNNINAD